MQRSALRSFPPRGMPAPLIIAALYFLFVRIMNNSREAWFISPQPQDLLDWWS